MKNALCETLVGAIEETRLVAIIRGVDKSKLASVARAIYDGGARVMEIPFDASGKISDLETCRRIALLKESLPADAYVGGGTVLDANKVRLVRECGGSIVVSPNTDRSVIELTKELGMVSVPGAFTPSEIVSAHAFGADIVKLFPAGQLGAGYIKTLKAPLAHIKLLAMAGITRESAREYITAGACAIGVSSSIVRHDLIEDGNYDKIREITRAYIDAMK